MQVPASLRSDFVLIASESSIHIAGMRNRGQQMPVTRENLGECTFFVGMEIILVLVPEGLGRQSEKLQARLIVRAFAGEVSHKKQRKTFSGRRIVEIRQELSDMAMLSHCVRQSDNLASNRASMTAEPFLVFGFPIGIELEGVPGRDCRRGKHGVVEEQLGGFGVETLSETQAALQQSDRGGFIGTRKNSRDMHQRRGADSRFGLLRLFHGTHEKIVPHTRSLAPNGRIQAVTRTCNARFADVDDAAARVLSKDSGDAAHWSRRIANPMPHSFLWGQAFGPAAGLPPRPETDRNHYLTLEFA